MRYRFANMDALAKVGAVHQPESFLEIGVWMGASLKVVLDTAPIKRLALCDLWSGRYDQGYTDHSHIAGQLARRGYTGTVQYLDGDSHVLLPKLKAEPFDLIHVDGDHSLTGAKQDLEDAWKLLRVGGHIVFDDILYGTPWPSEGKYWLLKTFEAFCAQHIDDVTDVEIETERQDGYGLLRRVS